MKGLGWVGGILVLVGCAHGGDGVRVPETRVVCTGAGPEFAFHSAFWLNLHNFLYREARARDVARGAVSGDPDPFGNFAIELAPSREPTASERAVWERAVEHYRTVVLPRGLRDSSVVRVNNALGLAGLASDVEGLPVERDWADALVGAAAVYREVWWPVHDGANRTWIESARELLNDHFACLAPSLARTLGAPWPEERVRVDVSVYASWFGAYTSLDPVHVTLSSTAAGNAGTYALESLLHEAGHVLLPGVRASLHGQPEPLSHMLLFYTAGELVRARVPAHTPFGERFGTYDRSRTQRRLFARLVAEWRPVLEGRRAPAEALSALAGR